MDIRDRRALKSEAGQALSTASCNPRKIVLLYAGAAGVMMLLLSAFSLLLQQQIAQTGGLSGLGARTALSTVQTVLQYVGTVVLPFWNMGYLFVVLAISRGQSAAPSTLLEGFRKFGPVLRFWLLENLIFLGLAIVCFYPSMMLYLMTPLAAPLVSALEPLVPDAAMATDPTALLEDPAVASAMMPMLVVFLIVYLLVAAPLFYRFRMAEFALVDNPKAGAIAAFRSSFRMMRGNRLALFRLDLSFWWFYALEALTAALCYGDSILAALGVSLPLSGDWAYFLFYALGLAAQTALYFWAKNQVTVTYAKAYDALGHNPIPRPAPVPKNQPWSY